MLGPVCLSLRLALVTGNTCRATIRHFELGTSECDWPNVVGLDCDAATDAVVPQLALMVVAGEDVLSPLLVSRCAGAVFTTGARTSAAMPCLCSMVGAFFAAVSYQSATSFVAAGFWRSGHMTAS
jgi:hypothetical protein